MMENDDVEKENVILPVRPRKIFKYVCSGVLIIGGLVLFITGVGGIPGIASALAGIKIGSAACITLGISSTLMGSALIKKDIQTIYRIYAKSDLEVFLNDVSDMIGTINVKNMGNYTLKSMVSDVDKAYLKRYLERGENRKAVKYLKRALKRYRKDGELSIEDSMKSIDFINGETLIKLEGKINQLEKYEPGQNEIDSLLTNEKPSYESTE